MRKKLRKMALHRETLRHLQSGQLRRVAGADSFEVGCESDSCPAACGTGGTGGCNTAGLCGSLQCWPTIHVDSGCAGCG